MTKAFRNYLALSFLLTVSLPGLAEPSPKITLRVYNYAQVPPKMLAQAEEVVTGIFRYARVEAGWLDCPVDDEQPQSACDQQPGPTDLLVRIVPGYAPARAGRLPSVCGIALRPTEGGGGTHATLYYDCLMKAASSTPFSRGWMLGYTVAHEIGHLLLPQAGHSRRGIMRAKFSRKDWRYAGTLVFTPEQSKQLRADVSARMRQQEAAQIASLVSLE